MVLRYRLGEHESMIVPGGYVAECQFRRQTLISFRFLQFIRLIHLLYITQYLHGPAFREYSRWRTDDNIKPHVVPRLIGLPSEGVCVKWRHGE